MPDPLFASTDDTIWYLAIGIVIIVGLPLICRFLYRLHKGPIDNRPTQDW